MYKLQQLDKKTDHRGWLIELLRPENLKKKKFGQIYLIKFKQAKTRGGHYHLRKEEWFFVLEGKVEFELIDLKSRKAEKVLISDKLKQAINVPSKIIHYLHNKSVGKALVLAYIDESFDPKDTDTYYLDKR